MRSGGIPSRIHQTESFVSPSLRKPRLSEDAFEDRFGSNSVGAAQRLEGQRATAVEVRARQRVHQSRSRVRNWPL
jgi:hypothetical protein